MPRQGMGDRVARAASEEKTRLEPPDIPGFAIDPEALGSGSSGIVFRARELATRRSVAIKWLPDLAGKRDKARFEREVRAAAALRHPHIATVFAAGELDRGRYIVMELVEGAPLSTLLERRAIGPNGLAIVLAKIARALDAAHGLGIVHRDVKPQNIMIDSRGDPRLVDFGLVCVADESRITESGTLLGTLSYMSPEVASGDVARAGPPCDVFSLGCILYEGLSGKAPFQTDDGAVMLRRIIVGTLDPLPREAPPLLAAACLSALARLPEERPTALELAKRLEAAATVPLDVATRESAAAAASVATERDSPVGQHPTTLARQDGSPGSRALPAPPSSGRDPSHDPDEVRERRADPGSAFGPYVLLSELGRGGMGVVHRAWDDRAKRLVALKTLSLGDAASPQAIKRFHREAEAVARLRHPGIVPLFEVGELEGKHYLAMGLIDGQTLEERLRPVVGAQDDTVPADVSQPRRIPLTDALRALRDTARALHYAHEQGVVHRDIKPANIMLDRDEKAHVLDFGVASVQDAKTKLTRAGARIGTLAYMSPEQAVGQSVDARTDVYSLGATLYDVLTNRPPFVAEGELALVAALAGADPVPPGSLNPRAAGDVEVICLRCLEKEPARRYASAGALADDLDRYLAGEAIAARPLSSVSRLWRRAKRNKIQAALASLALLAVLVAAALGVVALGAARAERERLVADARAEAETSSREFNAALAKARAPDGETPDAKQRRLEPLLGLGLRALEATGRLVNLSPGEEDARRRAFEAALELGDTAREAGQWSMAASALESAGALHVDDALAKAGLDRVESDRTALEKERKKEVEEILRDARSGELERRPAGREDAVFKLVLIAGPQTVRLLAHALDSVTGELESRKALDGGQALLARLACEALGRTGIREKAVASLGRYLAAETDELRAVEAGIALLRLGGAEAEGHVIRARDRFGPSGPFWKPVSRFISKAGPSAQGDARTVSELLERAQTRMATGDVEGAISDLTRVIALEPRLLRAWVNRTAAKLVKGDQDGAISDATRAIELDPRHAAAWTDRGNAKARKGDLEGAIADYSKAIDLVPDLALAWSNRGNARAAKRDFKGAIADYTKAIDLDPRHASFWANRGNLKRETGDLSGAIADQTQAIGLDPRSAPVWDQRGITKQLQGDREGAIADHTKAIELDPQLAAAWSNRGTAKHEKGDEDGAIADCTRAIELDPRLANAWTNRADAKQCKGDDRGAIQDCDKALELDPRLALAWMLRGSSKISLGDTEGAIADEDRAIELDPHLANAWGYRGFARLRAGDADGGIVDLTKAIELEPGKARLWDTRGIAKQAKGDQDGAIADHTKAIELDPRLADAWLDRAAARLAKADRGGSQDELPLAAKDLERFLELAPGHAKAKAARERLAKLRGR